MSNDSSKGEPIPSEMRIAVRAAIDDLGEPEVLRRAEITRQPLYRALSGLPVFSSTHRACRRVIDSRSK